MFLSVTTKTKTSLFTTRIDIGIRNTSAKKDCHKKQWWAKSWFKIIKTSYKTIQEKTKKELKNNGADYYILKKIRASKNEKNEEKH